VSNQARTFIDMARYGDVLLEEIDDYVDAWHQNPQGISLSEFLGMSLHEYELWVIEPDVLPYIVSERRNGRSLTNFANDNVQELRIAARSDDTLLLKKLAEWLHDRGYH
jgi:hypothetical protein